MITSVLRRWSGGFEAVVAAALRLAVVNPAEFRAFGRATGQLVKPTGSTQP
jgi:hypothetical protein